MFRILCDKDLLSIIFHRGVISGVIYFNIDINNKSSLTVSKLHYRIKFIFRVSPVKCVSCVITDDAADPKE